jgi:hypothetical protein
LNRNLIGAMVAVVFLLPIRSSVPNVLLNFLRIAVVLLGAAQLVPIAVALIDEHHARRYFPNLSDFQSPFQIHRWKGGAGMSIANNIGPPGNRELQADLTTSQTCRIHKLRGTNPHCNRAGPIGLKNPADPTNTQFLLITININVIKLISVDHTLQNSTCIA